MLENRRACRRRVLKSAMIEFEGGAFSCAVRNLSDAGAAVDVPTCIGIPPEFNLVIEKVVRHSRVVWRKDTRIGVRFEVPADG